MASGTDGTGTLRVGFIGLGRMGSPMAANLGRAGFQLTIYNRSAARIEAFVASVPAAAVAASPAELAASSDVIVTMLADGDAAYDVYLGPNGVVQGLRPGAYAIDMGTIGPTRVAELGAALESLGCTFIDAPVSGSVAAATQGSLTIMVAGEPRDVDHVRPILSALGDPVIHVGPPGSGAIMKLVVNTIVYGLNQAVSEALVLAEHAGLDRLLTYAVFADSAIAAPFVHYRRGSFERPEDAPVDFRVALASKDLELALDLAAAVDTELPQAERNLQLLRQTEAAGFQDEDVTAVARYLREKYRAPPRAIPERGG